MSTTATDRFEPARAVADAVLYEGYVLYPYRATSRKNQARFQWGVLTPDAFARADGSERSQLRTECVVDARDGSALHVRIRCLQIQHRRIEVLRTSDGPQEFEAVDELEVDGTRHVGWDEAIEHVIDVAPVELTDHTAVEEDFVLSGGVDTELLRDREGSVVGRFVRRRETVEGAIRVEAARPSATSQYLKTSVTVANTTAWRGEDATRDDAMTFSLVAVHTMMAVDDATFVSLLDPPVDARVAAADCRGEGTYPVLIGDDDVMLSSPIILYDHPEVAAQSPGDLYDSLEIDEILALRIMTLTDDEKAEARATDPRAAAIIDRCDDLSELSMSQLHGQMRPVAPTPPGRFPHETEEVPWWDPEVDASFDPWTETVWVAGVEISKGSPVRLRPSHRADAQDLFLVDMLATVAGVFSDVDGDQHVAVTVDDDPANEELLWQGRFLFFHPDEVDPLVERGAVS